MVIAPYLALFFIIATIADLPKLVRWIRASNPPFQSQNIALGMAVCLSAKPPYFTIETMSSLHEYENYLDSLDRCFYIRGSYVHVEFTKPFVIDIKTCSSIDELFLQTRQLIVRLIDEPGVNIQYLVQRLIRLASEFHGLKIDSRQVADSIGLVGINDVVYTRKENQNPTLPSLRFENGIGEYAGHHFVELERESDGLLQITRNMIGYPKHKQYATVSKLNAVETRSYLLLFLPEPLSWQFEYQTSDSQCYFLQGTRIALHHSFNKELLSIVRSDMQSLMEGLPFEYKSV